MYKAMPLAVCHLSLWRAIHFCVGICVCGECESGVSFYYIFLKTSVTDNIMILSGVQHNDSIFVYIVK